MAGIVAVFMFGVMWFSPGYQARMNGTDENDVLAATITEVVFNEKNCRRLYDYCSQYSL